MESILAEDTVYLLQAARLGYIYCADDDDVKNLCIGIKNFESRTLNDFKDRYFHDGSVLDITGSIPRTMFSTNPMVSHAGQTEEDVTDMNNILFRYNNDRSRCVIVCDLSPKGERTDDTVNDSRLSLLEGVFAGQGLISLSSLVSFIKDYRPRWEERPILIIDLGCKGNLEPPDPDLLFSPRHNKLARSESLDRDADVLERLRAPIPVRMNRLLGFDIWIMMAHSDRMHTQDPNAPMTPNRGLVEESPPHAWGQSFSPESGGGGFSPIPSTGEGSVSSMRSPEEGSVSSMRSPGEGSVSSMRSPEEGGLSSMRSPEEGGLSSMRSPGEGGLSSTNPGPYSSIWEPHDTLAPEIDPYGTNVGNPRVEGYAGRYRYQRFRNGSPYTKRDGSRGGRSPRRRDVRRSKRKSVRRSRRRSVRKSRRRGVRASKRKTMRRSRRKSMRRSRRKSAR